MDSDSKCQKIRRKRRNRISFLPDAVLCHILSFLPTKLTVQTSILSKRWRFKWASVPALDFDDTILFNYLKGDKYGLGGVSFMNFVDRVLIRTSESFVHTFRLKCSRRHRFHVEAWINAALKHRVQKLNININRVKNFRLPCAVFACQNLVVLKLCGKFVLNVPASFCFPNLKILRVKIVEFLNDDSTNKLFSSCPVLEDLRIKECELYRIQSLSISAPALKSLAIDSLPNSYYEYCSDEDDEEYEIDNEDCKYEIVVDAPNLQVISYTDYVADGYTLKNLCCLTKADIDVVLGRGKRRDISRSGLEILRGISNAKSLSLSGRSFKVFSLLNIQDFPMLHNLTKLTLHCDEHCDLLLPKLLENSPNLEVLVLGEKDLQCNKRNLEKFKWDPPSDVPKCLSHSLKTIQIWGFNGQENVLKFTRYLQENGEVSIEFEASSSQS